MTGGRDPSLPPGHGPGAKEEGVEVPFERIEPGTLRTMIQEFVTRDGADWGDAGGTLEEKVDQVLQQLRTKQVKVVFDLTSQTTNIVPCR